MDRDSEFEQQPQRPTPLGDAAEPQPERFAARLDTKVRAAVEHIELMAENLRVYLLTRR